ncbi:MAG: hypothetical protein ACKV2T_37470, partial [Kofleriaceae bacterium]
MRLLVLSWIGLAACGFQVSANGDARPSDARIDTFDGPVQEASPRRLVFANPGMSLTDFPVLVVLEPTNIDYDLIGDPHNDLRFEDVDGTILPFDVEQ